uniref:GDNF family receptor alpha like n=1 Tax=Chelydra serpentina TaxID=8475 RepID=A0A8C3RPU5_CHESE
MFTFVYFKNTSASQTTDCLNLREQCIRAANGCESVWNVIEDACNISGNSCKAKDSVGCNTTIQFLADQYPQFKDCICTKDDFCSIKLLLGKQCNQFKKDVLKYGRVSLITPVYKNGTCFDVNKECIEDEVCNKQLSLYLKVCSVTRKQCNLEQCQAAIRFFYQNMPFNVAQMLTFCDCTQPDESCQQAKELLHGKPCAVNIVPPPSLKELLFYLTFCWRHVTKRCYDDKACLETLIEDDLTCSGNADCRAAYIDNWGTMLRVECTCNTVPLAEQSLCKLFHQLLHSKSCFSKLCEKKCTMNGICNVVLFGVCKHFIFLLRVIS